MAPQGIELAVHNSSGSVSNVYAVYKRPRTQMGIVQSDVLAFVSKVDTDPVLKKIAKKIKMVFPLYNEEIHLVGNNNLSSFDDLEGKTVAIGQEGSGTYLTAKLLFKVSGIQPASLVNIGSDKALSALKSGEIDAMFYVAGYPVNLFSTQISEASNLQVLPITHQKVTEFYPKSTIPAATYSWQPESVETVAVKAVLVSYDFRNDHCHNVGRFAALMRENLGWLEENGHPKWQSVDLDYQLKGWEQYDCVKNHLHKPPTATLPPPPAKDENPILDAIKQML